MPAAGSSSGARIASTDSTARPVRIVTALPVSSERRRSKVDPRGADAALAIDLMRSDQRAVDVEKEGEVARRRQGGRDVAGITQGRWP